MGAGERSGRRAGAVALTRASRLLASDPSRIKDSPPLAGSDRASQTDLYAPKPGARKSARKRGDTWRACLSAALQDRLAPPMARMAQEDSPCSPLSVDRWPDPAPLTRRRDTPQAAALPLSSSCRWEPHAVFNEVAGVARFPRW